LAEALKPDMDPMKLTAKCQAPLLSPEPIIVELPTGIQKSFLYPRVRTQPIAGDYFMINITIEQASNGWIVGFAQHSGHSVVNEPVLSVFKSVEEIQAALPTLLAQYFAAYQLAKVELAPAPEIDTVNPPAPGT
jgi:hypothetical protein